MSVGGSVGGSRVGRRVAALLAPLDLTVVVSDPFLEPAASAWMNAELVPLDQLVSTWDVVSLHAPSTAAAHHMIGRPELAMLKDGAALVNTARGALIDHDALNAELASGRIDAILDVTEPESGPAASPLFTLPNVLLTPHVSGDFNPVEAKRQLRPCSPRARAVRPQRAARA